MLMCPYIAFYDIFEQFSVENWICNFIILNAFTVVTSVCVTICKTQFTLFKKLIVSKTLSHIILLCLPLYITLHNCMYPSICLIIMVFFSLLFLVDHMQSLSINNQYSMLRGWYVLLSQFLSNLIEKTIFVLPGSYVTILLGIGVLLGFLNLVGLVPFSTSLTSQILLPLMVSLSCFLYNNIIGILGQRFLIFNLFLPKGVPLFITPLLVVIETISYFARIFSLAIRLCANMLSVHVLLKILVSFIFIALSVTPFGHAFLGLLVSILVLDCSTCLLQAYIFIFLTVIYLSNVICLH